MESSRQDAIYELIDSEEDYVHDLTITINVYMTQLKSLLTEKEKAQLFSNVEQLLVVNSVYFYIFNWGTKKKKPKIFWKKKLIN